MFHKCPRCKELVIADDDDLDEWNAFSFDCNKCGLSFVVEVEKRLIIQESA